MAESVKTMLTATITLADQVAAKGGSSSTKTKRLPVEHLDLRSRVKELAAALRLAARADLYERTAERIIPFATDALAMTDRCFQGRRSRLRRLLAFSRSPAPTAERALEVLDAALADVAWLLRVSSPRADADMLGLPSLLRGDPKLFLVWDHIARVRAGSPAARAGSASVLASLARDSPCWAELIVEEDGVRPLVDLLKAGADDGKEAAAAALGLLGGDEEGVEKLLDADVCFVYAAALAEPSVRLRAAAAEAVASLADDSRRLQDSFAQTDAVGLLLAHLDGSGRPCAGSRNAPPRPEPMTSLHSAVLAKMTNQARASQLTSKGRSGEDPAAEARVKTMAAKAMWKLARGHAGVCQSIADSGVLPCLARLLDSGVGSGELRLYSAMTIMEIARAAERNLALRQSAFKPAANAAVTAQLIRIVREGESDGDDPLLLLPCVASLGCLSRTFAASQIASVIGPLVELLHGRQPRVAGEAVLALTKFVCTGNHLRVNHSEAIVDAGGAQHLVLLVYLGDDQQLQVQALVLLCCISLNVPAEKEELARAGVLDVLLWASKQAHLVQDVRVDALPMNAVRNLLNAENV